jgi:signal transduction histidine kinase
MSQEHATILLIEDNPGDARLIREMLPKGGGVVRSLEWVQSLEAGLRRIAQGGIDLVLLDLGLPGSTGLETLRQLRGKAAHLPAVVVMSGLGDEAIAVQAVLEGAQDYLVKGQVDAGLLIRSIRYALERNEAAVALQRAHDALEHQVLERTATLAKTIESLQREITERKRAEQSVARLNAELEQRVKERTAELEAKNKELESFCYSVSHDLRAPLRAIDGFSRIVLEEYHAKLDEEGRDNLRRVCSATQHMGQLIDDLLNLSRVTRSELHRDQVNLSDLAAQVAAELRHADPNRRVEIQIQPALTTEGDTNLLRIVLENLLGNAWKFTAKQPAARIEFGATTRAGQPSFFVRDNGAGFDMQYVSKLFGAFQRLHSSADFPGTGIGLASVQRIIRRHGGGVWAESQAGHGATFYFSLPRAT